MKTAENTLQTVLILARRGSLTVTALADELDVSTSAAHRLLATCKRAGFARQVPGRAEYRPGHAIFDLARAYDADGHLLRIAEPVLLRLRAETQASVSLIVPEAPHVRVIGFIEGLTPVRVGSRLGKKLPIYAHSGGKAILAELGEVERELILSSLSLTALTPNTQTNAAMLREELAEISKRGWATNAGETDTTISAVGAAVTPVAGHPVAAVAIAIPTNDLHGRYSFDALGPIVQSGAREIESLVLDAPASSDAADSPSAFGDD